MILSPDFAYRNDDNHQSLSKLFEDPEEKQQMIRSNIQRSQNKKRQRINSGNSNQSQLRDNQNNPKYISFDSKITNADLLKKFQEDIAKYRLSLEQIQEVLKHPNINQMLSYAFESAKTDVRMEEPNRILTRFAFDLIAYLLDIFNQDSLLNNLNS